MGSRFLRRVFSFPVMLAGLLIVLAVLSVRSRFVDPDMWWHLKTGEIIWTTHTIPLSDVFSYTTNHHSLIPQEWLSQVSIYGAYKLGGYSGLMLWLCLLSSAVFIAGYLLCALYSGNAKVALVGAMVIWFFSTIGLAIRPQMIGYLLLILEMLVIHLGRSRSPRWFLVLPLVFLVWINCHGSFMLGIVLAAIMLLSSYFDFRMGSLVAHSWDPSRRRMFIVSLGLSLVALFLNPVGMKQILYPFDTMLNMHILMGNVEEWAPLTLNDPRGMVLLAIVVGSLLLVILGQSEMFLDELLLLGFGTWLGFSHVRMLVVFGILAAPILSRQLAMFWDQYKIEEDRIWPNLVMITLALVVATLAFPSRDNLERQVAEHTPARAVEFIKANHLSGPMLNEYGFGGYLIWAAPELPVMIDGRTDLYEWSGFLGEFGNWATLQSDPRTLLEKYHVNFCLLTNQSPMVHVLPLLHEWRLVYSDGNAVIFVRSSIVGPPKSEMRNDTSQGLAALRLSGLLSP